MKKLFFFLLLSIFFTTANAQDNGITIDSRLFLTGKQWHFDELSILEANQNYYVVITPKEYYYAQWDDFDPKPFYEAVNDTIIEYGPYLYKNRKGWFIRGETLSYFYIPDKEIKVLYPTVYNRKYEYYVCRKTFIDLSRWHWYSKSNPMRKPPRLRRKSKVNLPKFKQIYFLDSPYYRPTPVPWLKK